MDAEYYWEEYEGSETRANALICKHLVPPSVKIQRAFRLWQWRKNIVWNPHTEIGQLNAMIQYNTLINASQS